MTEAAPVAHASPGLVDRALRVFTDVRAGESGTAMLLAANVFIILAAYQILKVLREPLVLLGGGGAVGAAYASAGQALLLVGLVPLYGVIASRVPRRTLINVVTAFFIVCLGAFFLLARVGVSFLGAAFFIWLGIFNVMFVAQFWAFANDVYTENEGKRLFPLVQFGASAGAVVGVWGAGRLIEQFGLYPLMLVSAGLLLLATFLTNVVDQRERRRTERTEAGVATTGTMPAATPQYRAETGEFRAVTAEYRRESGTFQALSRDDLDTGADPQAPVPTRGGSFRLVFQSRYLLFIALLILLLNGVNTTGEFILRLVVSRSAAEAVAAGATGGLTEGEYIGRFYSSFFTGVNLLGLAIQLFFVSRIFKHFGMRTAILVLPVIALGGYAFIAFAPVIALAAVRVVKTAENATDYSLQNTVRHALFLPTTREEKYKAKQAIDSFFWRAGDVMSAVLVFVGTSVLAFQIRHFAMVNLVLVVAWLVLAVLIGKRYHRLAAATAT